MEDVLLSPAGRGHAAGLPVPSLRGDAEALAQSAAGVAPADLVRDHGARVRPPDLGAHDNDLTSQHDGRPLGERIIVSGRVLDENGSAVPNTLVEIWQANAAGRYPHRADRHDAPLDPNFTGCGRT